MVAVTICSDFGVQENKVCHCFHCFPICLPWSNGIRCHNLSFWMLNFKPAFSLSSRSWWCHPTISSSVVTFSSCPQSFPASGSFQMSQFFASGGQSIGVSASTSVLPMNTQDWSPLRLTGLIPWQSKGLLRLFSSTTVEKHQFFGG